MSKLKPCPICGTRPIVYISNCLSDYYIYEILCPNKNCNFSMERRLELQRWFKCRDPKKKAEEIENSVVKVWNWRRT